MSRFYKTSTPKYEDFASTLPAELLLQTGEKIDLNVNTMLDARNLTNQTLDTLKFMPVDEEEGQEFVRTMQQEIEDISEEINANPLDWSKHKKRLTSAQQYISQEMLKGDIGKKVKNKAAFDTKMAEIQKLVDSPEIEFWDKIKLREEAKKYKEGYKGSVLGFTYTPDLSLVNITKTAKDIAQNLPTNTISSTRDIPTQFGSIETFTKNTSKGTTNEIAKAILVQMLNKPEIVQMLKSGYMTDDQILAIAEDAAKSQSGRTSEFKKIIRVETLDKEYTAYKTRMDKGEEDVYVVTDSNGEEHVFPAVTFVNGQIIKTKEIIEKRLEGVVKTYNLKHEQEILKKIDEALTNERKSPYMDINTVLRLEKLQKAQSEKVEKIRDYNTRANHYLKEVYTDERKWIGENYALGGIVRKSYATGGTVSPDIPPKDNRDFFSGTGKYAPKEKITQETKSTTTSQQQIVEQKPVKQTQQIQQPTSIPDISSSGSVPAPTKVAPQSFYEEVPLPITQSINFSDINKDLNKDVENYLMELKYAPDKANFSEKSKIDYENAIRMKDVLEEEFFETPVRVGEKEIPYKELPEANEMYTLYKLYNPELLVPDEKFLDEEEKNDYLNELKTDFFSDLGEKYTITTEDLISNNYYRYTNTKYKEEKIESLNYALDYLYSDKNLNPKGLKPLLDDNGNHIITPMTIELVKQGDLILKNSVTLTQEEMRKRHTTIPNTNLTWQEISNITKKFDEILSNRISKDLRKIDRIVDVKNSQMNFNRLSREWVDIPKTESLQKYLIDAFTQNENWSNAEIYSGSPNDMVKSSQPMKKEYKGKFFSIANLIEEFGEDITKHITPQMMFNTEKGVAFTASITLPNKQKNNLLGRNFNRLTGETYEGSWFKSREDELKGGTIPVVIIPPKHIQENMFKNFELDANRYLKELEEQGILKSTDIEKADEMKSLFNSNSTIFDLLDFEMKVSLQFANLADNLEKEDEIISTIIPVKTSKTDDKFSDVKVTAYPKKGYSNTSKGKKNVQYKLEIQDEDGNWKEVVSEKTGENRFLGSVEMAKELDKIYNPETKEALKEMFN